MLESFLWPQEGSMKYGSRAYEREECAVERTLDIIGNRWTSLIVRELLSGPQRFDELCKNLQSIPPKPSPKGSWRSRVS